MSDCLSGLSPLARGTQFSHCRRRFRIRFIPAGAGNTRRTHRQLRAIAVYPRWRGEHVANMPRLCAGCGLSPLARGTLQQTVHKSHHLRFIPAGAGNTRDTTRCVTKHAVYPRWRGEHMPRADVMRSGNGLSPLARGTPCDKYRGLWCWRFIPAGAGNTAG